MKILFLFTDMVRANLLKTYNQEIKVKGPLDNFISELGGTLYTQCYTPAPDTPRSLACFNSGTYPEENGCNTRIKWPYYYYYSEFNIFESFLEDGYKVHYFATKHKIDNGPLPKNVISKINIYNKLSEIENVIDNEKNSDVKSIYFLTLDDYHWTNDDYGHNSLGDYLGQKKLYNYLTNFFNNHNKDNFDYVVNFSDHGHKLNKELKNQPKIDLINDDRTKIHLLVRKKNEYQLEKDNQLRSILDIYPTFLSLLKKSISPKINGKSIFGKGHDHIFIEDHATISVSINQTIDLWGVKTKTHHYYESVDQKKIIKIDTDKQVEVFDEELMYSFNQMLKTFSHKYNDFKKQLTVLSKYYNMKNETSDHCDNTKRLTLHRNFVIRIVKRVFRNYYKRW